MAVTPIRNLRVDDERWVRWKKAAEVLGVSVSGLMVESMDGCAARVLESAVGMPMETLAMEARRGRAGMCPHRIPVTAYCSKCDG